MCVGGVELASTIFEYIEGFHNAGGATAPSAGHPRQGTKSNTETSRDCS